MANFSSFFPAAGGGGPFVETGTVTLTWENSGGTPFANTTYYSIVGNTVTLSGLAGWSGSGGANAAVSIDDASLPYAFGSSRAAGGSWSSTEGSSGEVSNYDGSAIDTADVKFTGARYGNGSVSYLFRFTFTYLAAVGVSASDRRSNATAD